MTEYVGHIGHCDEESQGGGHDYVSVEANSLEEAKQKLRIRYPKADIIAMYERVE